MREKIISTVALAIVSIVANLLLNTVLAWPFAFVWNGSVAALFRLPNVSYWESLEALTMLCLLKMAWNGVELTVKFRE